MKHSPFSTLFCAVLFLVLTAQTMLAATPAASLTVPQADPTPSASQEQQSGLIITGLRVTVTDAQQRSLNGVTCSLLLPRESATVVATATTDEQGVAAFTAIAPGAYILRIESEGFEAFTKSNVVVKDGGRKRDD
jgi:hypothetical protein